MSGAGRGGSVGGAGGCSEARTETSSATIDTACLSGGTLDIFLESVLPATPVHVFGDWARTTVARTNPVHCARRLSARAGRSVLMLTPLVT